MQSTNLAIHDHDPVLPNQCCLRPTFYGWFVVHAVNGSVSVLVYHPIWLGRCDDLVLLLGSELRWHGMFALFVSGLGAVLGAGSASSPFPFSLPKTLPYRC